MSFSLHKKRIQVDQDVSKTIDNNRRIIEINTPQKISRNIPTKIL